jgi:hypothetical protein
MPPLYCAACLCPTRLFHRLTLRRPASTASASWAPGGMQGGGGRRGGCLEG